MYLRASNVSLHFRLTGQPEIRADDSPGAEPHLGLGGTIEAHGRHKFVRAIDDVSLDLRQGDRLAIIGHNGSGKSTLLKVLAGIYYPQRGVVESDRPVTGIFNISMGFRQEASGYRNIMLKGLIAGKSRAEIERAIPEIADFTELGPYLHMPIRTYSQGMAMRLAFSIATAFSSDILLMDEWIGAGDARFSEKIVRRMTGFVDSAQILVLASHSSLLLRRIANRAIWLESGRIREAGSVNDILDRYESEAKANARAMRARQNLRKGEISLTVTPAELPNFRPGDKGVPGEVTWDTTGSQTEAVELFVVSPAGQEKLCHHGGSVGFFETRGWIRPGVGFRLKDADTGEGLASVTVLPLPQSVPQSNAAPSLIVTPAELPNFRPGDKGVAGVVTWDIGSRQAESVELFVVSPAGQEKLCHSGGNVGTFETRAWLRPGVGFRLKDADSGEVLASVTIPVPSSTQAVAANTAPPSLTVSPAELPNFRSGDKGVAGVVAWDVGSRRSEAVELFVVSPAGQEKLCHSGGPIGYFETRAWIRPGVGFRLKDADSGEVLASVTVPVLPQPVAPSSAAPSLTVTPAELPDFRPGDKGVSGVVAWDARASNVQSVLLYTVAKDGEERLCYRGSDVGRFETPPWIRAGTEFRLRAAATNDLLAAVIVGPAPADAAKTEREQLA
jgi:ABC-type polysaccharide/polyol phosphate transport system ATPase subunit